MRRCLIFASALLFAQAAQAANPRLEIKTSHGTLTVELFPEKAPRTVDNFLAYARDGFYDRTIFHRVIPGFMIQGGGFTTDFRQKDTRPPVPSEAKNGLKNEPGTLAMARTSDPHSATAQFFINLVHNTSLDYPKPDRWGYAVFGRVVQGFEAVERIAAVETAPRGPHRDVPVMPVVIESVKLLPAKQ